MNIDEMPANRELDILIARKVMGWEVRLISYNYANLPDDWRYQIDHRAPWLELPYFSTDIAAADTIIDQLHELNLCVTVRDDSTAFITWCEVHKAGVEARAERHLVTVAARTRPHAISLAAFHTLSQPDP
jgi:hypothetical protein